MAQKIDRIRTTHVGSLVRPPKLVNFLRAIEDGASYDKTAYEAALKECIVDVVQQQAEVGVDFVSDGEFGKGINWAFYVHRRLGGIRMRPYTEEEDRDAKQNPMVWPDRKVFAEFYAEYDAAGGFAKRRRDKIFVEGPLKYTGQDQVQRDIANLKAAMKTADVEGGFLPVVAPASALPHVVHEYYKDEESFLFGLADALHEEYKAIADAGLFVQVDDAFLTTEYERLVPPMTTEQYRRWVEMRLTALNHALRDIPEEQIRYHVCWGSWNGPHIFDVPLKLIIDLVLKVRAGYYLFEAANPRHAHEWKVWQDVKIPENRVLIPGVISHATNVVEHPEFVAERLVRFAKIVGRERVMAGTDCGFAQSPFIRRVHPSIVWAKLKAMSEGAALATKELWG